MDRQTAKIEGLYYENGKIRITKNIFSNGQGQTFMIPSVRAVRDEYRRARSALLLIAGALCFAAAMQAPIEYFDNQRQVLMIFGALLIALFVIGKNTYRIFLTTPEGEVLAFRTQSAVEHTDIMKSLKRAVASHQP